MTQHVYNKKIIGWETAIYQMRWVKIYEKLAKREVNCISQRNRLNNDKKPEVFSKKQMDHKTLLAYIH